MGVLLGKSEIWSPAGFTHSCWAQHGHAALGAGRPQEIMQQCWHPQLRFATSQLQADNPCRTSNPCRKIAVTSQQLWFAYSQRVYITSHFDVSVLVLISNTAVTIFTVLWSNITICWNISRNGKLTATGLMLFIHAYGDKSCKSEAAGPGHSQVTHPTILF